MAERGLLIGLVLILLFLTFGTLIFALFGSGMFEKKNISVNILPGQSLSVVYINTPDYSPVVCRGRYCDNTEYVIIHHEDHHEECEKTKICADSQCHIYKEVCKD